MVLLEALPATNSTTTWKSVNNWQNDYDAFGNKINSTGTTPNNYLYRGEQLDSDLGLYYLRARYYNPITGRFMSRDPWEGDYENPQTLHKYTYADGDPINLTDATGRNPKVGTMGGPSEEYIGLAGLSLGVATAALPAVRNAIVCAYRFLASNTVAMVEIGLSSSGGTVSQEDDCWVQVKFDRCRQLEDDVQKAKTIASDLGGCTLIPKMTKLELQERLGAWKDLVNKRIKLHDECFAGEPDEGHSIRLGLDLLSVLKCEAYLR